MVGTPGESRNAKGEAKPTRSVAAGVTHTQTGFKPVASTDWATGAWYFSVGVEPTTSSV